MCLAQHAVLGRTEQVVRPHLKPERANRSAKKGDGLPFKEACYNRGALNGFEAPE